MVSADVGAPTGKSAIGIPCNTANWHFRAPLFPPTRPASPSEPPGRPANGATEAAPGLGKRQIGIPSERQWQVDAPPNPAFRPAPLARPSRWDGAAIRPVAAYLLVEHMLDLAGSPGDPLSPDCNRVLTIMLLAGVLGAHALSMARNCSFGVLYLL